MLNFFGTRNSTLLVGFTTDYFVLFLFILIDYFEYCWCIWRFGFNQLVFHVNFSFGLNSKSIELFLVIKKLALRTRYKSIISQQISMNKRVEGNLLIMSICYLCEATVVLHTQAKKKHRSYLAKHTLETRFSSSTNTIFRHILFGFLGVSFWIEWVLMSFVLFSYNFPHSHIYLLIQITHLDHFHLKVRIVMWL